MNSWGGTRNRLLAQLPQDELKVLLRSAEKVEIRPRQILHHWRLPMEHAYFIERGLVSVSARVNDDDFVEAWLIGSEGMVGAPLVLAEEQQSPPHRRIVQVGGDAVRIPTRDFQTVLPTLPFTRRLLQRYVQIVLFQASQFGACNAVHSVKERLVRWLLAARSGLDSDDLPITHEVLAQLLGVRRATVTEIMDALQTEMLIRTTRGRIRIADAEALQGASCACFGLVHREYKRHVHATAGPERGSLSSDRPSAPMRMGSIHRLSRR